MMTPVRLVILFALLATSRALAGAVVTLTPATPGPYQPGQNVVIDVFITSSQSIQPRLLGFDFSRTDPAIGLAPEFDFNLTPLQEALYGVFPTMPLPIWAFNGQDYPIFYLPANVPVRVGSLAITMPTSPCGFFTLDAMNYAAQSTLEGARIDFGWDPTTTWSSHNDGNVELTGGMTSFGWLISCPEPTTLVMLALGIIPLARRRAATK